MCIKKRLYLCPDLLLNLENDRCRLCELFSRLNLAWKSTSTALIRCRSYFLHWFSMQLKCDGMLPDFYIINSLFLLRRFLHAYAPYLPNPHFFWSFCAHQSHFYTNLRFPILTWKYQQVVVIRPWSLRAALLLLLFFCLKPFEKCYLSVTVPNPITNARDVFGITTSESHLLSFLSRLWRYSYNRLPFMAFFYF